MRYVVKERQIGGLKGKVSRWKRSLPCSLARKLSKCKPEFHKIEGLVLINLLRNLGRYSVGLDHLGCITLHQYPELSRRLGVAEAPLDKGPMIRIALYANQS